MRIGLVGAGPWARSTHGPALAAHPGVEFAGVWARRPDAAAAVGAPVYDSYDALLADVDAVSFAVPPEVQAPMAVAAAEAGKHMLLDKPIAATLDEARRLADAVGHASVRSIVALTRRFAPETRAFLAETDGRTFSAGSGTWLSGAVLGGEYSLSEWRHRDGALFDVGPHVFDLLDVALGPIAGVALARLDAASDTWTVVLEHDGGAISTSSLSLRTPVQPSLFRVELSGSDGVVSLADRSTPATDCFAVLLDEFLESIESGIDHPCSVQRGLHLQKVLAHVSANT
ncbi:Gfo/Idh/MocA family oxidoreductase [Rhodococcus sp. BP-252]|uniref:Oxidoreductase n=1 Tax=Rhodococcoides kyotonense TaxID=398843 RepID=A0A177YED8_9NOCA|nr:MULTISPECIES: Gfo/Idh/MocA family oxidoreductase [Rhodococcus]MBY6410877.1 Gfo/Idh/MocA family oxidoreductase [Rhodococcus sp. BP-320]MBY6415298.1 Gfo/Idh/MocA family oxidoreductase [Rhodococcus sp. BP-321]MBY6419913.1 Gfo/Idh/MocA family oxidoreductase [Rhodococcus sp. BP-324]MBY6425433.1 Gfo/Idh/MocA family oxidoreductase [Rhodococcus sp. BP-323]MBY6430504.1 Gfo/Idh/MocA family oxidoreductase [Rhodococcus sp. BP-322]